MVYDSTSSLPLTQPVKDLSNPEEDCAAICLSERDDKLQNSLIIGLKIETLHQAINLKTGLERNGELYCNDTPDI